MIDRILFYQEFDALCERFGRKMTDTLANRYCAYLDNFLTTAQMAQAIERAYNEDDFFPSPQKLLEKVLPTLDEACYQQWEQLLDLIRSSSLSLKTLSKASQSAVVKLGGLQGLRLMPAEKLEQLRDKFAKAYAIEVGMAVKQGADQYAVMLPALPAVDAEPSLNSNSAKTLTGTGV